ncbi:hypothetical protein GCM10007103_33000 [Salinimicrobium marinum]|uniref:Lipoprotein n=1 Tax=Salinimicrobium marinum TaxID=680283 RepID=A0A918SKA5_9FLAO|nr:hypothetical protein [Salinimicrobium marinum]GHA49534.1 hypothetical protein GCM10007103_33000 [Salinimicrobium marinum]
MKKPFIIFLFILLIGCSKEDSQANSTADLEVGESTTLDYGQCHSITGPDLRICLDSISDSRCPDGSTCVWEGDAIASFTFRSGTETNSFSLHTYRNYRQDTIINGLKIELLEVTPYPVLNTRIDPKDYSAELLISN